MEDVLDKIEIGKYASYKDSGVEWLGELPEHWKVLKLKRLFHEKKKVTDPSLPCGSISFGKVVFKDDERIPEATKRSYQVLNEGEFLLNPLNLNYDLISLRISLSEIKVVVSSGYIILQSSVAMCKQYFKWLLHRYDVAYMKTLGSGVRQTINYWDIGDSLLAFPPLDEQERIALFLDEKTAKIDKAIALKEKQIELLKERKQILIHKAVTRGLNPNVKLKESGVEWIGQIPAHWNTGRIKNVSEFVYDGTHGSFPRYETGYRLLSVRNMIDDEFVFLEDDSRVSSRAFKEISAKFLPQKGDIMIAIVGATLGKVAVLNECEEKFVTQRSVATIRTISRFLCNRYLFYYLQGPAFQKFLWMNAGFSAQPGVYLGTIQNAFISFPNSDEQFYIVKHLEETSNRITKLINSKLAEIEHLKSYKVVLVNEAVTGKIKVT